MSEPRPLKVFLCPAKADNLAARKWIVLLCAVVLLSACLPALTPVPLRQAQGIASPTGRGESAPPPAGGGWEGVTPAPTETPTPTPVPTYSIEQLKAMTPEQKLALAPDVSEAPSDVLASYLPTGAEASSMTWGEQTLTFWERVVAYNGTTADGQSVTMYYDLESGQWAKKYASFEDVAQIPAEKVPDVMVLTDAVMGDDRLIRAKLQYDYDWISQPQVWIDGKKVFRDEKGYPKAVFDTKAKKWLTPEEADVVFTLEKWKALFDVPFIITDGTESNYSIIFFDALREINNPSQIEKLPKGTDIIVLNPSGEITVWVSKEEAVARLKEGAVIMVGKGNTAKERIDNFNFRDQTAWLVAFHHYQQGNKTIYVTYGDVGVKRSEIMGWFSPFVYYKVNEIPQIIDPKTGRIVCPVIRMPKYIDYMKERKDYPFDVSEPDFWLDEAIKLGAEIISMYKTEDSMLLYD